MTHFILPFIYSILIGGVWGLVFNKKFSSSLAPAYMSHIIIVLLSGMVFKRLTIGIYGGIALSILTACIVIKLRRVILSDYAKNLWAGGGFLFSLFYVFFFIVNVRKIFINYDEFMHWGRFLKECLRLDRLYCMSSLDIIHKDYVPAITLFETIWIKLGFRFKEKDAYVALQVFMFSMLMPMFEKFADYLERKKTENDDITKKINSFLFQISPVIIALLIPLILNENNWGSCFYHSIYCDIPSGILLFWCVYQILRDYDSEQYRCMIVTLGAIVFVLSKMINVAFLPFIGFLYLYKLMINCNTGTKKVLGGWKYSKKRLLYLIISIVIPGASLLFFNKFVKLCTDYHDKLQSFDLSKILLLKDVFGNSKNSSISLLSETRDLYIDALIHRDVLIHGSYIYVVVIITIIFFILAHFLINPAQKKLTVFIGCWSFIYGIFYALLMYFLYCTSFPDKQKQYLNSYERYMNEYIIMLMFLLLAVYFDSEIWKRNVKGVFYFSFFLYAYISIIHGSALDQVMPGFIVHADNQIIDARDEAKIFNKNTLDDSRIVVIRRENETGSKKNIYKHRLNYYCLPRTVNIESPGSTMGESDDYSKDISNEEFLDILKQYDYVYFKKVDDVFKDKYSSVFETPSKVMEGTLYRIIIEDSKVALE